MNPLSLEQLTPQENPLWQQLLNLAPDAIFIKDLNGSILICNLQASASFGATGPDTLIGKTDFDFLPELIAKQRQASENAAIASKKQLVTEEQLAHPKTKQALWFQVVRIPLFDDNGKFIALHIMFRDITEQKRAQQAWAIAQKLEERVAEEVSQRDAQVVKAQAEREQALQLLQALLDHIPDTIYFKDVHSRFIKCSAALAQRIGLQNADEAIGKTDFDFHPKEKATEFFEDEQRIIKSGIPIINKVESKVRPNGETVWTSTTKVPLRDKTGTIVGIIGVNRDITDQIRADELLRQAHDELEQRINERTEALARERRLLRTLIDNLPDAIYAKDGEGRKSLANPADLRNMRCKTEADALGKTDFDLFPPDIAAKFYADDQKVLHGEPVMNREEFFFNEQGKKCWLLSSKLPVRDDQGKVIGLIGIGRDITSLKEAEAKLEAVHRELMQASRQAGMAEVATGVLHNVGNVLNSLNVSAGIIAEKLRTSKVAGVSKVVTLLREHQSDLGHFLSEDERGRHVPPYLEQLAGHLERERTDLSAELDCLSQHIGHIKQVVTTQQDYAKVAGVVEKVALSELIEDAMKIQGAAYLRHGVNVTKEYEDLPEISVDKHRVLQILINLLTNAKHACDAATHNDRRVVLRLKAAGPDRVQVQVADNGMGIAKENLTRIFSQGFTTKKDGHGFGLHSGALAAKEMGGSLAVRSDGPGLGATFTLELPIAPQKT